MRSAVIARSKATRQARWADTRSARDCFAMLAMAAAPQTFSTCEYSSSTGVARPKIDTATLIRDFSSSTSSTTPLNEVNGPSETRTCSPLSKTPVERGERPVGDAPLLARLEDDRRFRPFDPLLDLAHDPRRLIFADRR